MLPRTFFSSHVINTNGFSKNKSEAFWGLWDLSRVTDVGQFWRLLLILHTDALLLGYKFSQTSGDKVLSKSIRAESAPQGRTYKAAKGSSDSQVCSKAAEADVGRTAGLWGLALLATLLGRSRLIPSLTAGWRVWFCTHKSKPHLVRDETWSFVCLIVISAQGLLNVYDVSTFWYREKTQEKERFPPLSSVPHAPKKEHIAYGETVLYTTV